VNPLKEMLEIGLQRRLPMHRERTQREEVGKVHEIRVKTRISKVKPSEDKTHAVRGRGTL